MTTELVPEGASTPAPPTSDRTDSWLFQDFISDEHKQALLRMAGLTVDPDVIHINGNTHELEP